ncbi:MAG: glycosyltransferase family 2 protein [Omnitrophica bacterium]|nr:glycosyltransferase family 2 protein [Candidatus Omnitrophota bacterium]
MNKLTVIIPCFNNEDIIRDCLESVKWADEILVCDSFSTDKTLEIVKEFTDRIIQQRYINSALQKNWALPQARNEWVLLVDTDERVTVSLQKEILEVLGNPQNVDGFYIPYANFSFGRRLKYGGHWPAYQLRLFKKSKGIFSPKEVHARVQLCGKCKKLKNYFVHIQDRDVDQIVEKFFLRYVKWEAKERLKTRKFTYAKLILLPPAVFIDKYVFKLGFLDGIGGFINANLWAIYFFLTYLHMMQWTKER